MARTSSICDHFDLKGPLFDPYDLDLQPTRKNLSNGNSPPRGQQLCKIILKSMYKCTSYGPDKMTILTFN